VAPADDRWIVSRRPQLRSGLDPASSLYRQGTPKMARMKTNPKMKWNTTALTLLAETFNRINAQKYKDMPDDIAALASEAMTKAPDALHWAVGRIDDLERRLRERP
jgi:hypothetical protein